MVLIQRSRWLSSRKWASSSKAHHRALNHRWFVNSVLPSKPMATSENRRRRRVPLRHRVRPHRRHRAPLRHRLLPQALQMTPRRVRRFLWPSGRSPLKKPLQRKPQSLHRVSTYRTLMRVRRNPLLREPLHRSRVRRNLLRVRETTRSRRIRAWASVPAARVRETTRLPVHRVWASVRVREIFPDRHRLARGLRGLVLRGLVRQVHVALVRVRVRSSVPAVAARASSSARVRVPVLVLRVGSARLDPVVVGADGVPAEEPPVLLAAAGASRRLANQSGRNVKSLRCGRLRRSAA